MSDTKSPGWHGTTIVGVRKGSQVVVAGDGQVSLGPTVIKGSARKVRRLKSTRRGMMLWSVLPDPRRTPLPS